jgi:xenotropic and polytropic retrovirus receptor 1
MVKFSKELEAQLIPEWKDAFVNYWQLKKHVKKIKLSRTLKHAPESSSCEFGRSIFSPVRLFAAKISEKFHNAKEKPEIIQVYSCMVAQVLA